MADLVSGARVPGVSLSNDLRILGQIVQRLCRVRFRHVPYFLRYVTDRLARHSSETRFGTDDRKPQAGLGVIDRQR